jgi:hypothetical protein
MRRHDDATFGLKKILNYSKTRSMLTDRARESLRAIISLKDLDENTTFKKGSTLTNFFQVAASSIWKNRNKISASFGGGIIGFYELGQWMIAN